MTRERECDRLVVGRAAQRAGRGHPLVAVTGSPYGYTNGDPLNGTDPLGLWGWHNITKFVRDHGTQVAVGAVAVVGTACVFSSTATDVVVDRAADLAASAPALTLAAPTRAVDSRAAPGRLAPGAALEVPMPGARAVACPVRTGATMGLRSKSISPAGISPSPKMSCNPF